MEIVDNIALQAKLNKEIAERVIAAIPESEQLSDGQTIVKWDHAEAETLAHIMDSERPKEIIDVPSPIMRDYKWPGFFTPMNHQKVTAAFLSIRPRAYCFSEAGTGKTSAAIWAADYLMKIGVIKSVLIICPLSIMYSVWQTELFKIAMHRRTVVAYSKNANKRKQLVMANNEFTIINYDGIGIVLNEMAQQRYDLIIVDEANAYKNTTTKRWRKLAGLMRPSSRLWLMTGTPAAQSPMDAFGLAKLVSPDRVPKYMTSWKDSVMTQISRFTWVPKYDSKEKVFKALQPAIRFPKADCVDLPPVTYQTREVPLSVQVARYYKELKQQLLIEAAGQEISAVNAAAALSKLLQISGGAVYTDQQDIVQFDVSPRLNAMTETIDELVNKVVVFVPFLHTIPIIANHLKTHGIISETITGATTASERHSIVKRFQEEKNPKVLLCQPATMSHGVTLTAADTIIFWSPVLSVETYLQCVARIDRIGQVNKMTVVHLVGSEVERKLYSMLSSKVSNHLKLVDLYRSAME